MFIPIIVLYIDGYVQPDTGFCIQYSTKLFPIILLSICDALFSIALLALFVLPLKVIASQHEESSPDQMKRYSKLSRKNLFLSLILVSLTTIQLMYMLAGHIMIEQVGFTYHNMLSTAIAQLDVLSNLLICHMICTVWYPWRAATQVETQTRAGGGSVLHPSLSTRLSKQNMTDVSVETPL